MLGEKRLIQSIRLQNFLSFGPEAEGIELKSLNVLIGPNPQGKSNLIKVSSRARDTGKPEGDWGRKSLMI